MLSRTAALSAIALAALIAAFSFAPAAQAGMGNANFNGSKSVSSRPLPTPPRVQAEPPRIETKVKLMHCYHTREPNQLGIYVHRTHCG